MDRTVPRVGSDEIELYIRTYYSLLRSTSEIKLEGLVEAHANMASSLHANARSSDPDLDALTYTSQRLPECITDVQLLVLGQSQDVFIWRKYPAVESWEEVSSPGRRRRLFFDGTDTLAVYIASRSDIDDLIPILVAYQVEWNKLHHLLQGSQIRDWLKSVLGQSLDDEEIGTLAAAVGISFADAARLRKLWGKNLASRLLQIAKQRKSISLRLLDSSLAAYRKTIRQWWDNIERTAGDIDFLSRPIFFVSSNTHSIPNLLTGWALRNQQRLVDYLHQQCQDDLITAYEQAKQNNDDSVAANILYYVQRSYLSKNPDAAQEVVSEEQAVGIFRIPSSHSFDVEMQVIRIDQLNPDWFDPRVPRLNSSLLSDSRSLIVNIDYPLGMAAYQILTEIARNIHYFHGIYVLGKAATLNGRVGDVMIPNVVYDEHSQNTYLFQNCFTAADIAPWMNQGSVMDNQKAITVRGTFLQNPEFMAVIYREGYTDIEMEAGPYLSAIYESIRPKRHPYNEIVNLHNAPFDIGLIHYASDKPMSKGQSLGTGGMEQWGMEATYASSVAILDRIMCRLSEEHK